MDDSLIAILLQRQEQQTYQTRDEVKAAREDIKSLRLLIETAYRRGMIVFWLLLGAVLHWNPQQLAEYLAALKGLK